MEWNQFYKLWKMIILYDLNMIVGMQVSIGELVVFEQNVREYSVEARSRTAFRIYSTEPSCKFDVSKVYTFACSFFISFSNQFNSQCSQFEQSIYWHYFIDNEWWKFEEDGRIRQEKSGAAHEEIMESSSTILFRTLHSAAIQSIKRNQNSYASMLMLMHYKLISTVHRSTKLCLESESCRSVSRFWRLYRINCSHVTYIRITNLKQTCEKMWFSSQSDRLQTDNSILSTVAVFFDRMQGCHRRNG